MSGGQQQSAVEKRGARGEARRREILEAAERVFGRRGYAAATTAEVASQVGLTQPALYRYFPSKQALFMAALAFRQKEMASAFGAAITSHASPLERIRAIGRVAIDLAYQYPDMARLRLQASALAATDDEMRPIVRGTLEVMSDLHERLIREAINAGEVSPDLDPATVASVISGQALMLYAGLSLELAMANVETSRSVNDHIVDVLLRGGASPSQRHNLREGNHDDGSPSE